LLIKSGNRMPIANPVKFDFLPFDPKKPPYDDGEPLEKNRDRIAMNALINSAKQVFKTRRDTDFFAVLNIDGSYSRED
jgi:hypothetical protein